MPVSIRKLLLEFYSEMKRELSSGIDWCSKSLKGKSLVAGMGKRDTKSGGEGGADGEDLIFERLSGWVTSNGQLPFGPLARLWPVHRSLIAMSGTSRSSPGGI